MSGFLLEFHIFLFYVFIGRDWKILVYIVAFCIFHTCALGPTQFNSQPRQLFNVFHAFTSHPSESNISLAPQQKYGSSLQVCRIQRFITSTFILKHSFPGVTDVFCIQCVFSRSKWVCSHGCMHTDIDVCSYLIVVAASLLVFTLSGIGDL